MPATDIVDEAPSGPPASDELRKAAERIEAESGRYTGGPIQLFERVGRDAFVTLLRHGLLPSHRLLDFGAGCLRLGYWFARFLDAGNYYAIEPSMPMLEAGKKHLFGAELVAQKLPHFYTGDDCRMTAFGTRFDYVVARSILTHTKPAMLHRILAEFAASAAPDGSMLASYWAATGEKAYSRDGPVGDQMNREEWGFVKVVKYSLAYLERAAQEHGLSVTEVMLDTPRISEQIWLRFAMAGADGAESRPGRTVPSVGALERAKRIVRRLRG